MAMDNLVVLVATQEFLVAISTPLDRVQDGTQAQI
jgi:hypothetical protein